MPIPFILTGLGLGAAALGIGGHLSAQETNEKAQQISEEAQKIYNKAKQSLETAQISTENSLLILGYSKKNVMETSMKQFVTAFERIKNIELRESVGLDEISNLTLDKHDILELKEMSNIYESTFSSGAAGAATGAVIALAASGSLPILTGALSTAGTALMAGEIGTAAGIAGSALSFGAAVTPLAAIAAPALLFSGINSSMKADENLEKAYTMYAEAEVAVEKMQISEDLCYAITNKADMFDSLLNELNIMFSQCAALLDGVTRKKMGFFKNKEVDYSDFSKAELKLFSISAALAKSVKTVIDTPILNSDGSISYQTEEIADDLFNQLSTFNEQIDTLNGYVYDAKPIDVSMSEKEVLLLQYPILDNTRNILAIIAGVLISFLMRKIIADSFAVGSISFAVTALLCMEHKTESTLFKLLRVIYSIAIAVGFSVFFYNSCVHIVSIKLYLLWDILIGIGSNVVVSICLPKKDKSFNSFKLVLIKVGYCVLFFTIAILIFALLYKVFGISYRVSAIITLIPYSIFALMTSIIHYSSDTK